MKTCYGYFGPKGTNSEEALYTFTGTTDIVATPFSSIEKVLDAVRESDITYGLVPIENSIEGTVNLTLDLLAKESELFITGEVILSINHNLLVKQGIKKESICKIISHPQALAQCRAYLKDNFPDVILEEVGSTAEAARLTADSCGDIAAIGNCNAAKYYGLDVLASEIHDCADNTTRFIVISKEAAPVTQMVKTSIVISITDRPGGLYEILKAFAVSNINLTKIESRPAKKNLGDYLFFLDFIGSPHEERVSLCLKSIQDMTASFRILGSYPLWQGNVDDYQISESVNGKKPIINEIRQDIDIIDYQIVELLAKRTQLVSLIGSLKASRFLVRDPGREEQVLARVKNIAENKGVAPELLERIYKYMFEFFVEFQKKQLSKDQDL